MNTSVALTEKPSVKVTGFRDRPLNADSGPRKGCNIRYAMKCAVLNKYK